MSTLSERYERTFTIIGGKIHSARNDGMRDYVYNQPVESGYHYNAQQRIK